MELWIIVLWGMYHGWSEPMTAKQARTTVKTVRKCKDAFYEDPSLIFKTPVLTRDMRWKTKIWRCQFCESVITGSERSAREHVAGHVLVPEAVSRGVMVTE